MSENGSNESQESTSVWVDEEGIEDVDEHDVAGPGSTVLTYFGTDFDIHGLVRRLDNGDIVIPTFDPAQDTGSGLEGFQRRFVWRKPQMDRFIESLLLGYPVPGIFLVQGPDKRLLVLDGQQRLRTLHGFIHNLYRENPYALDNVGQVFHRLSYPKLSDDRRREFDNTFIHATIVRHDESPEGYRGVYQLFERLNTGGTNLQPQEIRVALFHGRYVELLRSLNEVSEWRELYGRRSERLKDQELILRYLAMLHDRENYSRPLKIFLNDFLDANQTASVARCEGDRELFTKSVELRLAFEMVSRAGSGRQEIVQLEREVRELFQRYEVFLRESELGSEIRSDISKFVCVRICGFVEQSLIRLTIDHAAARSSPTVQSFVGAVMTRVRSPRRENLSAFAGRFGDGWAAEFEAFLEGEDPNKTLNSLVQTRNDIAHGLSTGVGHDTLERYLELAASIAEWFALRLDPAPSGI